MDEEYYTIDEVAKRFKVSRGAVYKWMRSGDLPFVYVGKDRRITGTALRAFVRPGSPDDVQEDKEDRQGLQLAAAANLAPAVGLG